MQAHSGIAAPSSGLRRWELWLVAAAAALLILHVRTYWFLTDDAFISFRYARNWAEGMGLVFNPGAERVEGYSNFLWVVLLAAGVKFGVAAEQLAPWLSVALTALLWIAVVRAGRAMLPTGARGWSWVAPLALAMNRSFAVWATGGLETRLFEALVLTGLGLLWWDTQAARAHGQRRGRAAWVLAFAALTRPDAMVLTAGAALAAEWLVWRAGRWHWRTCGRAWAPLVALVTAHTAFRVAYYGAPLPNTFYAKFGGTFAGDWGALYVVWFVTEYALALWVPFWIAGARAWRVQLPGLGLITAAAGIPYVLYVVWAGGDHFEFRMLDVLWVPLALLLQSGVADIGAAGSTPAIHRAAPARRRRAVLAAGAAAVALGAAGALPLLSHRQFPPGYVKGFPGTNGRSADDHDLVRADRLPAPLQPALRPWIAATNALARRLTLHFVGLRQEEHRAFRERVTNIALDLQDLIAAGVIPADTRIALHCVGVVPYVTRLWTLDRLGLCDAHVGRSPWAPGPRILAHGKLADAPYIASRGVEMEPVLPVAFFTAGAVVREVGRTGECRAETPCYVAPLGPDLNLFVRLPAGIGHARTRFPQLEFQSLEEWLRANSP